MAKPKVFISSTCYDLGEVRDSLSSFVKSMGFEPILSEHGDVFFHPDLHTHEACIHEVGNCQLFILLIGGRFGGTYINDSEKSVTNAEYEAAVQKKLPVFTYIKRNVLDNHNTYQTNKDKSFVKDISYSAIDKQGDSSLIFEFINRVRRASVNNGYEPFEVSKDIEVHLRKQWAGMFFDFLKNREVTVQINSTNEAVNEIQGVTNKLEAIITNIYKVVDKDNADQKIEDIRIISIAKKFLQNAIGEWQNGIIETNKKEAKRIFSIDPKKINWYEYLIEIGILHKTNENEDEIELWTPKKYDHDDSSSGYLGITIEKHELNKYLREHEMDYESGLKLLSIDTRKELVSSYISIKD